MTRLERSLLADDALIVRAERTVAPWVMPWLPLHAGAPVRPHRTGARIEVFPDPLADPEGAGPGHPLLAFGGVHAFTRGETVILRGASTLRGEIGLGTRRARLHAPADAGDSAGAELYSMLTLASAFLVGRLGGALVHAAAVVDADGFAWLLVGDTHAGKTTTCVSLVDAGWRWLADDQVVLRPGPQGEIHVQGWPRRAHLDEGWETAVVTGTRGSVDLRERWADRWLAGAPLGGVLLPAVHASEPTRASVAESAPTFAALVRQSPWLMADRDAARTVMSLLQAAAQRPALQLTLGRDSYARGDVLAERLGAAGLAALSAAAARGAGR